jgi:hypothetical protein
MVYGLTPAKEKKVLVLDIGQAEGQLDLEEQVHACKCTLALIIALSPPY